MRKWFIIMCAAAILVSITAATANNELDNFRGRIAKATSGFKDLRLNLVVTQSNRRELEKMGKVFAETYQFKKANVWFKSPDKLKINGQLGMMKVEFVTNGNERHVRIPAIRFKNHEDITTQPEKHITSLDVGVVSEAIWQIYTVELLKTEKDESGAKLYVLRLGTPASSKKSQIIWVEDTHFKLIRREGLMDDGSLKIKILYTDYSYVNDVYVPTRCEVYNGEGKLAATTEMKNIQVNTGIDDDELE